LRFEERVGEPEDQQPLDGLLAEVVVDPEDRLLVEGTGQPAVQLAGRLEVASEGLLDDDPAAGREAGLGQPLDDLREDRRRDGEVEDRPLGALQPDRELVVQRRVAVVADQHRQALGQLPEGRLVHRTAAGRLDGGAGVLPQPLVLPGRAGHPDHGDAEPTDLRHLVERGHQLLAHQVARRPEQDDRVRPTLHAARSWWSSCPSSSAPASHTPRSDRVRRDRARPRSP
jgi:hypothetical protein